MLYTTKIRLYPSKSQQDILARVFGCVRFVYNEALRFCKDTYEQTKKSVNYHALALRLPSLKQSLEWLKEAPSQAYQQVLKHLEKGYKNFFTKRTGFPSFKSRRDKQSFALPQGVSVVNKNTLKLPKMGEMKAVIHREIVGKIKTVTIMKDCCEHYYASILSEDSQAIPEPKTVGKAIGLDLGLTHLLTDSDGNKTENDGFLKEMLRRLKKAQQDLSRKKKGSANREKNRLKIAKIHKKIANKRLEKLHQLTRKIVDENQVICVEDLAVRNMVKNRKLARSISDVGWGNLVNFLSYKAERAGKVLVKVGRFFASSKTCSDCGIICKTMGLEVKQWSCEGCGTVHDRDVNAAKNILKEGLRLLSEKAQKAVGATVSACGETVRPVLKSNLRKRLVSLKQEAPTRTAILVAV